MSSCDSFFDSFCEFDAKRGLKGEGARHTVCVLGKFSMAGQESQRLRVMK
jgi:hypothetical protein